MSSSSNNFDALSHSSKLTISNLSKSVTVSYQKAKEESLAKQKTIHKADTSVHNSPEKKQSALEEYSGLFKQQKKSVPTE